MGMMREAPGSPVPTYRQVSRKLRTRLGYPATYRGLTLRFACVGCAPTGALPASAVWHRAAPRYPDA
jgi:hypothetical protein